jgi:hypothetical protein
MGNIHKDCLICFENRICPPLSYGCCHFDICPICLVRWNEVNHGIERCPVCREIQYEKPFKICCFRCKSLTERQKFLIYQILIGQMVLCFIYIFFERKVVTIDD